MLELLLMLIVGMTLAVVLGVRLTEKPLRIGFTVVEPSANVFATQPVNLPSVPSVALARGGIKALGIEIMGVVSNLGPPDPEDAQNNTTDCSLRKGPAPVAVGAINDQRTIWQRVLQNDDTQITAVGHIYEPSKELIKFDDLTDHDGNGEIVADNEIHASILGAGNGAAKRLRAYLLYHLVEVTPTEALFELIETNQ